MDTVDSDLHFYTAYGLDFESRIRLPALMTNEAPGASSDVRIRTGEIDFPEYRFNEDDFAMVAAGEACFLIWRDVAKFRVSQGSEILVDPAPGVRNDVLRLFVQGTTLAILLYQRGLFLMHGSAVSVDGRAAVFVGDGGAGKSTTSAALYRRGHRFVADDLVAIDLRDPGCPMVVPGYPQAKLWGESVTSLGDDLDSVKRLRPELEKFAWQTRDSFELDPLPLGCVYILGLGDELKSEKITGQAAILLLLRYLYVSRFSEELNSPQRAIQHLQQAGQIATRARVRSLIRRIDLGALDPIAQRVEDDAQADRAEYL